MNIDEALLYIEQHKLKERFDEAKKFLDEHQIICIRQDTIRKGAKLVEAYETDEEIIVMGTPDDSDDHNCDAMGCGWQHVMWRFKKL